MSRLAFASVGLLALSFPFDDVGHSVGLTADLRLTNVRALTFIVLVLWALACVHARRWPGLPPRAVSIAAAAWLIIVLASALAAPTHPTFALAFARDLWLAALIGWAAYDLSRDARRWLVRALAMAGAGVGLVGLAEAAHVGVAVEFVQQFRYESFAVGDLERVSSTLPHPNIAAAVLELTLPLLLAWAIISRRAWQRTLLFVALAAGLVTVVATLSRSGFVVLLIELALMVGFAAVRKARGIAIAAAASAAAMLGLGAAAAVVQPSLALRTFRQGTAALYAASYAPPETVTIRPGESMQVPVRLANTGLRTWQAGGDHPFALSYHLLGADDMPITYDGPRTLLPADVPPGGEVQLQASVAAPPTVGDYVVQWDGVEESAVWFSWTGSPPGRTHLTVAGPPVPAPAWQPTPPPAPALLQPAPGRLELWRIALRMARNRPLLGVGPDNFRWVYGDFAEVAQWDTGVHANSAYFEALADTGLLGAAAFLAVAACLLRACVPRASQRTSWLWQLALFASLSGWFIHGLTDYFYSPLPTNVGSWLLAGIALGAQREVA